MNYKSYDSGPSYSDLIKKQEAELKRENYLAEIHENLSNAKNMREIDYWGSMLVLTALGV